MKKCQQCRSERLLSVHAHSRDCSAFLIGGNEHVGYVPGDLGLGKGDAVEFTMCMDCGQVEGNFPLPQAEIERGTDE